MTTDQWENETPEWDRLVADRLGRGPTEFEGYETWDDSDEAKEAYARGVAEAEATKDAFWGRVPAQAQPDAERAEPQPADARTTDARAANAPAAEAHAAETPAAETPAAETPGAEATRTTVDEPAAGRVPEGATRAS